MTYPTYTAPITDAESALYKPFLKELIDAAFGVIGRYFLRDIAIVDKANGTPVTAADKGAEEKMRAMIEERFPEHGIYGEEYGIKEAPTLVMIGADGFNKISGPSDIKKFCEQTVKA